MGAGNDEALETSGHSLRATADLCIGTPDENDHATYDLLLSCVGFHDEEVDWLTLLTIYG